jgi:MFS family permease
MKDFSILAGKLGQISSGYFLVYTFAQIPVGFLMKRFSAKFLLALASFGCALCAIGITKAPSFEILLACYLLFSFFGSFGFVGAVTFASQQIPQHQSLLVGLTQSLGMAAGFAATNWLTYAIAHGPWQHAITQVAAILCATGLLISVFACRGNPISAVSDTTSSDTKSSTDAQSHNIFFNAQTWLNAIYIGTTYFPVMMIVEGGVGPSMLASIHTANTAAQISFAISMTFVGWMVAGPFAGMIADKYGRVLLMRLSALCGALISAVILYVPLPPAMLCLVLFLFGVTNTGLLGSYSVAAEMHGKSNAAVSVAIANMFTILIGAVLCGILPTMLELHCPSIIVDGLPKYEASSYQYIFSSMIYIPLISLLCASFVKETGSQFQKLAKV